MVSYKLFLYPNRLADFGINKIQMTIEKIYKFIPEIQIIYTILKRNILISILKKKKLFINNIKFDGRKSIISRINKIIRKMDKNPKYIDSNTKESAKNNITKTE